MKGHTCLTGRDVGLPDKGGSGPTWLGRKEGAGLPRRSFQEGAKANVNWLLLFFCTVCPYVNFLFFFLHCLSIGKLSVVFFALSVHM